MFCHAAQSLGLQVAVLDPAEGARRHGRRPAHPRGLLTTRPALRAWRSNAAPSPPNSRTCPPTACAPGRALPRQPGRRCRGRGTGSHRRKTFIAEQGIPRRAACRDPRRTDRARQPVPRHPPVARMGYDGRGQARIATREEALAAYAEFGGVPCVLEALMPLDYEISVVLARGRRRQRGVSGGGAPRRHPGGVHRVGRRPGRGPRRRQAHPAAAQSIAQGSGLPARAVRGILRPQGRQPDRQ